MYCYLASHKNKLAMMTWATLQRLESLLSSPKTHSPIGSAPPEMFQTLSNINDPTATNDPTRLSDPTGTNAPTS